MPDVSSPPPPPWTAATQEPQVKKEGGTVDEGRDDLRAVAAVLPKLPEEGSHQAPLRYGDWIAEVAPLIQDVSAGAGKLWSDLMAKVGETFRCWLAYDPLTRLTIDIPTRPNSSRLEGRVTSLLLTSLPQVGNHCFEEIDGRCNYAGDPEAISTWWTHGKGWLAEGADSTYNSDKCIRGGR